MIMQTNYIYDEQQNRSRQIWPRSETYVIVVRLREYCYRALIPQSLTLFVN